jgi:hypothetical protein
LLLAPPRENTIVHRRLASARMQSPAAAASKPGAPLAAAAAVPAPAMSTVAGFVATGVAR